MRRQTWAQRNQAIHVLNAYAEMMNAGKSGKGAATSQSTQVPADDLFDMMGVKVKS